MNFGVIALLNCLLSVKQNNKLKRNTIMTKEVAFFDWDVIKAGLDSWYADCRETRKEWDEVSYTVPGVAGAFLTAYWEGPSEWFPEHKWLQIQDLDGCDAFENGLTIDTPEGWAEATASIDRWSESAQKDWE